MLMKRLWTVMALVGIFVALLPLDGVGAEPQSSAFPSSVYFPQTGHNLSHGFLSFWRSGGGIRLFGYPITEEFREGEAVVQYFERARFEYWPSFPPGHQVLLGRVGAELVAQRREPVFMPLEPLALGESSEERIYFPETGHTLAYGFLNFWRSNGGLATFGYPISEEFTEVSRDDGKPYTVQYFERARFEYHPEYRGTPYEVLLGRVGAELATARGLKTEASPRIGQAPDYTPELWPKWIDIDLSQQVLTAYEGDMPVFTALVSTGIARYPTPTGSFRILYKLPSDDMTGGLAGTDEYYYLPDVPWVMYFRSGGYAIHGTYWHNNFGRPMSHGCVNMRIPDAQWLYGWAPVGTPILVHY
jgi:hypothetical protein